MMKQGIYYIIFCLILSTNSLNAQTFWTGDFMSFTKAPNADWNLESNQDRLTNNVWITRKNTQSIFNIAVENGYGGSSISPVDTEWAFGQISNDVTTLNFMPFVQLMGGAGSLSTNVLNHAMVLHLISDDIYVDIEFNQWSQGSSGGGGFAYRRSTSNTANIDWLEFEEFSIYPNPAKNKIKISGLKKISNYTITNMLGAELSNGKIQNQNSIDISNLKKGIYFIEIENKVIKFIKN